MIDFFTLVVHNQGIIDHEPVGDTLTYHGHQRLSDFTIIWAVHHTVVTVVGHCKETDPTVMTCNV